VTRDELLAMTVEEHIGEAATIGSEDSTANIDGYQLRQLAVQSHLLWAIVKRGQKRDQR
jgi:hypothetical protein